MVAEALETVPDLSIRGLVYEYGISSKSLRLKAKSKH